MTQTFIGYNAYMFLKKSTNKHKFILTCLDYTAINFNNTAADICWE